MVASLGISYVTTWRTWTQSRLKFMSPFFWQLRYRPTTPMVLKGITLTISGGEKVGVVGRTGSGKSTLIQALFRLVEPSGGRIVIDGVDIVTLGLSDLRSKFGIIPQEPTLFQGTVRANVDPLQQYADDQIWEVMTPNNISNFKWALSMCHKRNHIILSFLVYFKGTIRHKNFLIISHDASLHAKGTYVCLFFSPCAHQDFSQGKRFKAIGETFV